MRKLRLVPDNTAFNFIGKRYIAFAFSLTLFVLSLVFLATKGMNYGIDFRGGIQMEVRAHQAIDVGALRGKLATLGLGEVQLQQFGGADTVLINIQQQPGGDAADRAAVEKVHALLGTSYDYRRVDLVGPKVGSELLHAGIIATALAIVAITLYVGFRFEWQFGLAALIATFHDVITTAGLFSILGLEFNLTAVAALLTLAGYSINDTVVVFDRVRETLRKNKTMPMTEIINVSVNQTLSRTILTSGITLMAILPLLIYGGDTLYNFTLALTWGIVVGTYSSIYVAAALLLYMKPIRRGHAATAARSQTPASAQGR